MMQQIKNRRPYKVPYLKQQYLTLTTMSKKLYLRIKLNN